VSPKKVSAFLQRNRTPLFQPTLETFDRYGNLTFCKKDVSRMSIPATSIRNTVAHFEARARRRASSDRDEQQSQILAGGNALEVPTISIIPLFRRTNSIGERNLVNTFRKRALKTGCFSLILWISVAAVPAKAQNQELTFSLGGIPGQTRGLEGSSGSAHISADRTFGINYAHRLIGTNFAALYAEIQFVAIPNRPVSAATAVVPQNCAALYLTPGVQLKLFPGSRLSPWAAVGGGYALYQQSAQLSNGQNSPNKFLNRGVFDYDGGLDSDAVAQARAQEPPA